MKKIRTLTIVLLCTALCFFGTLVYAAESSAQESAQAKVKTYVEGTDYEVRAEQKTETPEIREFFSFWCGHCYMLTEPFEMIARAFRNKAEFVRNPVGILGGAMGEESQKAFAVAKMHGLEEDFYQELMKRIHLDSAIPESHEDYVRMFEGLGIDAEKFNQEFNSFPVQGKKAEFDALCDKFKLDAVPEVMVNGKYYIKMDKLDTVQDLIDIISYLLALP